MAQSTSEIPYTDDNIFLEELNTVDEIYFSQSQSQSSSSHSQTVDRSSFSDSPVNNAFSDTDSYDEFSDNNVSDEDICSVFELSKDDAQERNIQNDFRLKTCGCTKFYSKPCSSMVDFDKMIEFREFCQEMSREELDLVVKAELSVHRCSGSETSANKKKERKRKRHYQKYFFNGIQVCKQVFCFTHAVGKKKLQNIASSLDRDGLTPRIHGLVSKPAKHGKGITYLDMERIKVFLQKYAEDNALPVPGRLPNFRTSYVYILPSDKTTEDIYGVYKTSVDSMNFRCVSLRSFQRAWQELCPHITIAKPATDLCQKCQDFSQQLSSGNLNDTEKAEVLEKYSCHVELAKKERDYYRQQCLSSKDVFSHLSIEKQTGGQEPCSTDGSLHYSWDYAQQVHYPHHAQQTGPIFFKTPRKCSVFGICSEGSGNQVFYLVDEGEGAGKGANAVISMTHHYFQHHSHGENNGQIHFDNCPGQNKNNAVIWYTMWRTITGLHRSIELSMMIAGHTKFHPDWHFGIWKNRWRHSNAESMEEIAATVSSSSRTGHNIPQLVTDEDTPVVFYQWKDFLSRYFRPLKHLSTYQHFVVQADRPGIVFCRETVDSEVKEFNLMKKNLPATAMPEVINSKGLDPQRQWYLYDNIREFCRFDKNKDISCPKPAVSKKEC